MFLKMSIEGVMRKRVENEKASIALEAVISFSLALLIVFSGLGTLLSIYVDTQIEWAVKNVSDELKWAQEMMHDQTNLTKLIIEERLKKRLIDQRLISLVTHMTVARSLNVFPKVDQWNISYEYTFLSLKKTGEVSYFFTSGMPDDGLSLNSATVFITNYGEKYHIETCFHLRKSKYPIDLIAAQEQGYDACKNCHGSMEEK